MKLTLKIIVIVFLFKANSLYAKTSDAQHLPAIKLGIIEEVISEKEPRHVNYLVLICAAENREWRFDSFDVSHSLMSPRLLATQVFSSGSRDGEMITQFVRVSADYLDVGDVDAHVIYQPKAGKSHKGVRIEITDLIRSGKYERHKLEESTLTASDTCSFATPLNEDDVKLSFGAKIH